jgi:hypothetical protein
MAIPSDVRLGPTRDRKPKNEKIMKKSLTMPLHKYLISLLWNFGTIDFPCALLLWAGKQGGVFAFSPPSTKFSGKMKNNEKFA